mmetsp:Transcript_39432/g.87735  ORF Transcript_39432/g.87735 Transcript_39432/m.87735 type:complete len:80 (-) Transcript_39432:467-706(-)
MHFLVSTLLMACRHCDEGGGFLWAHRAPRCKPTPVSVRVVVERSTNQGVANKPGLGWRTGTAPKTPSWQHPVVAFDRDA